MKFRGQGNGQSRDQEEQHHTPEHPSLLLLFGHAGVHENQGRWNQQDGEHLQKIAEGRRILERVGAVDPEVSSAVGPQLLDRDLGSDRTERDRLGRARGRHCGGTRAPGLDHSLSDEEYRPKEGQRKQNMHDRSDQISPEVSHGFPALPYDASDEGQQHGHSSGRADEVLDAQPEGLHQGTERAFSGIGLPVGVGHEADRRVECQRERNVRQPGGIERQAALKHLERHQRRQPDTMERQQAQDVRPGRHLNGRIDSRNPVKAALQKGQRSPERIRVHSVHPGHVRGQRRRQRRQNGDVNGGQNPVVNGHGRPQKRSGFIAAYAR
jgi:hypothetical protein